MLDVVGDHDGSSDGIKEGCTDNEGVDEGVELRAGLGKSSLQQMRRAPLKAAHSEC
jgi:hypothetical protein